MKGKYKSKAEILALSSSVLNKSLRDVLDNDEIFKIENDYSDSKKRSKGLFGELVEEFVFNLEVNNYSIADFEDAGIELKTTPLKKHSTKKYVSKERLVFSMIDYNKIVNENWEDSSFLNKNNTLLILFYLWVQDKSILDYKFKYSHLLNLLVDISSEDIYQIQEDWEFIVNKIKAGEAHLLSEGDTYYLGACTKAANSSVRREQPESSVPAKPRAFSLKQQYLNYLIQTKVLGNPDLVLQSLNTEHKQKTIDELVEGKIKPFIGKTNKEIYEIINWHNPTNAKNWKRQMTNRIFGVISNNIAEIEKANITLKVVVFEHNGNLNESISFPSFKFKELIIENWFDDVSGEGCPLYQQLETKRFLFVVYQKVQDSDEIILRGYKFWNFPMAHMDKAHDVWKITKELIEKGEILKEIRKDKNGKERRFTNFPDSKHNGVVHVRPHAQNSDDVYELPTPEATTGLGAYTKHSFWINAAYIKTVLQDCL